MYCSQAPFFISRILMCVCFSLFGFSIQGQDIRNEKIDQLLQVQISEASPGTYFPIIISLSEQLDTRALNDQFRRLRSTKTQRVQTVISQLQAKAEAHQPALLQKIRQFGGFRPESIERLWIANGVFVEATTELILYLAQQPEIRLMEWDAPIKLTKAKDISYLLEPGIAEPALSVLNAHKLWEMGYSGYGTKVMIIDSGVDLMHPALRTQSIYNTDDLSVSTSGTIIGDFSDEHGTAVAGAILGLDRLTMDTLGAAFNTQYLDGPSSNLINSTGDFEGSVKTAFSNLQWALNPDGNASSSYDVPDVVNNSWGLAESSSQFNCNNSIYRNVISSLNAAGVSVLFAAGNDGPSSGSINFPGALALNEYVPLSVGATDNTSNISSFSGRGPSTCGTALESIKPEVVAPGQQIRTTSLFGRYERISGTSFSTPYVAGIILLLKEAFPYLDGEKLQEAIVESASDLGSPGDDNLYGNGRVDALAAFNYLVAQGNTPVNPAQSNNDVILVEARSGTRDCGNQTNLELTVANDGTVPIRTFTVAVRQGNTGDLINSMVWEGEILPGDVETINPGSMSVYLGNYPIQVTIENPNGSEDRRSLNNSLKLDVNITNDPILPVLDLSGTSTCIGGQVSLNAREEEGGTVLWYDQSVGGTPIAEGSLFQTPPLYENTAYFSALQFNGRVGLENRDVGTNTLFSPEAGLEFDAFAPFVLNSVKVYAESLGPRIIVLREPDGQTQQKIINITQTGEQRIDLNFGITPDVGYKIVLTVGQDLYITTTDVNFPRQINNVVSIRKSVGTVATFYPFFYDWDITYEYGCGRVPVTVTVDDDVAPVVDFTFSQNNGNGPEVEFQDLSSNAVAWQWRFGDGGESTDANPNYIYNEPGTYQVELTATGSNGCTSTLTQLITVEIATSTIEQQKLLRQIKIQPNPANDMTTVYVNLDETQFVRLWVTDVTGRTLQAFYPEQIRELQWTIDMSNYASGVYFVITQVGNDRVGQRLVRLE